MSAENDYFKIRVTDPPRRDPASGGPALSGGKLYLARRRPDGTVKVHDDNDFPTTLEQHRWTQVTSTQFGANSIAFHRDRRARSLGVAAGEYLVTGVWDDQYEWPKHGKEAKGVRVDLGVTTRHRQDCWSLRCLVCPQLLHDTTTREAAAAKLALHHEQRHPRAAAEQR